MDHAIPLNAVSCPQVVPSGMLEQGVTEVLLPVLAGGPHTTVSLLPTPTVAISAPTATAHSILLVTVLLVTALPATAARAMEEEVGKRLGRLLHILQLN